MKSRSNVRLYSGLAAFFVVAMAVAFIFLPAGSKANAANGEIAGGGTVEMLNYALNFKSASNLGVFGGSGVTDQGSEIRGTVGSTGEVLGVSANALSTEESAESRRDLLDVFSVVDQLPCSQVSGDLAGQTFSPGVYCVGDATLAGRMTVDAGGDANARFVFRVDGDLTARDSSSIQLTGEAQATNVYVFASRSAVLGTGSVIDANIIARDSVRVGHGSTVSGKVIGVSGSLTDSNIVAAVPPAPRDAQEYRKQRACSRSDHAGHDLQLHHLRRQRNNTSACRRLLARRSRSRRAMSPLLKLFENTVLQGFNLRSDQSIHWF